MHCCGGHGLGQHAQAMVNEDLKRRLAGELNVEMPGEPV
jgi:hypothetical protein